MADVTVVADAFELLTTQRGTISHSPPAVRNKDLDQVIDLHWDDTDDTEDWGVFTATISITGSWLNMAHDTVWPVVTLSIIGTFVEGQLWSANIVLDLELEFNAPEIVTEASKRNWVQWSNIGHLDFTVWKDNVAGERPLDWKGWVYALKKLGNRVIAYGQNGVSVLTPAGNAWGLQTIHRIGLKGKGAVCGDEKEHYFVDAEGRLCKISDQVEILDYSEYLDGLSPSITLNHDVANQLVYICDGQYGYIYSPKDSSMGQGPTNIAGIGSQGGVLFVSSPAAISTPVCQISTDIYDFGTRKSKIIRSVELGTENTQTLSVAIDYRRDKAGAFSTTDWRTVNAKGVAYITCYGHEFRIKVKSSAYEWFALDYITVNGAVNDN